MDTYTLKVSSPLAIRLIDQMIEMLKKYPELEIKQDGDVLEIRPADRDLAMMLPGKPMSWGELKQELINSEKDYKNGDFYTVDEIRNEIKNW